MRTGRIIAAALVAAGMLAAGGPGGVRAEGPEQPATEVPVGGAAGTTEMAALPPESVPAAAHVRRGPVTNLPLPRYVSLKTDEGRARRGPGLTHGVDWVFVRREMPLRVTAEHEHWRRVEDREGAGGWVHYALLSGVRTALVEDGSATLHARPDPRAPVVARAEAGAIVRLLSCRGAWCRVAGQGQRGWMPKAALWGVGEDEAFD